jgi:hypothetical protein
MVVAAWRAPGRPVTPGQVGDGDQRFPGVGGLVLQRHRRGGMAQFTQMLARPATQPVTKVVEGWGVAAGAVGLDLFAGGAAAHPHDHGPVHDGVGQLPDGGQQGHGEGVELFGGAAGHIPAQHGPVALVAGIQQAAQVLVGVGLFAGAPQGVGLIDQQGGWVGADGADDGGDGGVDGDEGGVAGLGDHVQQPALATPLERANHGQAGGVFPGRLGGGGRGPQGDGVGGLGAGEDHIAGERLAQLAQQPGPVHRRRGGAWP